MIKKEEKAVKTKGYRSVIISKKSKPQTRLMIGIPMTGLLRSEWVMARYSQVIPCNWSQVEAIQWVDQYSPLNFLVADARNLIVKDCVEKGFEWLCFKGDTEIETKEGAKFIKDINIGDKVKTHRGRYRTVNHIIKRDYGQRKPLFWIKTPYSTIKCTPEHPFLICTSNETKWVKARNLNVGDNLLYPMEDKKDPLNFDCYANTLGINRDARKGSIKNGYYHGIYEVDVDLARFLGFYLAEGNAERDCIGFTFNNNETEYIDFIKRICESKFNRSPTIDIRWATRVKLNIRSFSKKFSRWFGENARNKHIPDFVKKWSAKNRLSFIRGYIEGDGSIIKNGGRSFISASEQLIDDLISLASSCGLNVKKYGYIKPSVSKLKNGHIIKNSGAFYGYLSKLSWERIVGILSATQSNGYVKLPIKKIENHNMPSNISYYVYNLEVEEDNSYIANNCIAHNCFIDHDVVLPPTFFVSINDYMLKGKIPIVGGLYFTKSVPSEPLVYRGRGNSYFANWKLGDKVWVDGSGCGSTLIHVSILKALYGESEEYELAGQRVRKVFDTPSKVFFDPETQSFNTQTGTEDLYFYSRIIKEDIFKKAGWPEYQRKKYPFLIDTKLFSWHIDWDGNKYPMKDEHLRFMKE